jgi:hypothetical protein
MMDTVLWHDASTPVTRCVHCMEKAPGGHYTCTVEVPCQDCYDAALYWAEEASNYLVNDYGPQED